MNGSITRRTALQAAGALGGLAAVTACSSDGGSDSGTGTAPSGNGGRPAPLARVDDVPVGRALAAKDPDGKPILLVRDGDGRVTGLSAICTHQGCTVAPDSQQLTCPCHGSQFTLDGQVKRGPAERPLPAYPVAVDEDDVLPA